MEKELPPSIDDGAIAPRRSTAGTARLSSSRARVALGLTLAFWGSNYVLLTLGTALSNNPHLAAIAGMRILTTLLGLSFCYLIHLLLMHPRLATTKRRLIALVLVAPVAAETFAWAVYFSEAAVDPSLSVLHFTWSGAIRTISFWTWFFLAWAGVYLALMYSFDVQEEQQRSAELREQAHVAQLRALHSQINPHFLFNSLNSLSALILDKKMDDAEAMVVKLARFLRLGLKADPSRKIPLSLEMELQRSYLGIEQLRYPDLAVDVSLPEELEHALVPALILQPIIENAVKYGIADFNHAQLDQDFSARGRSPPGAGSIRQGRRQGKEEQGWGGHRTYQYSSAPAAHLWRRSRRVGRGPDR